jgi:hypothetical protein
MMKNTIVNIHCDLCGELIKDGDIYNGTSETQNVGVWKIVFEIWYGGSFLVQDTCRECNKKVSEFLRDNKMVHKAQKQ